MSVRSLVRSSTACAFGASLAVIGCGGLSSSQLQIRAASADKCLNEDVERQPDCLQKLPLVSDNEPTTGCAYYVDSKGWVTARVIPREVTTAKLKAQADGQFPYANFRAASRGCLTGMANELATQRRAGEIAAREVAQRVEEYRKKQAQADVQKKLEEAHIKRVAALTTAANLCGEHLRNESCDVTDLTDAEKADYSNSCTESRISAISNLARRSVYGCVSAYLDDFRNTHRKPFCKIYLPNENDLSAVDLSEMNKSCVELCSQELASVNAQVTEGKVSGAGAGSSGHFRKCRQCFLATGADADAADTAWCESKVPKSEWMQRLGPTCDSSCVAKAAYNMCIMR